MYESLRRERDNEGFAFFYCNHTDSQRRDAMSVLRSFVRQLASPDLDLSTKRIHPDLEALYKQSQMNGSGWTIHVCQEYLLKLLDFFPRTTLILDALDECEDRTALLNILDQLVKATTRPVKILISSRPEGDIRQRLGDLTNVEITAAKNDRDIIAFIEESMEVRHPWTGALRNDELREEVVTTLVSKSAGMFQWVKLQIHQLQKLDHEEDIREKLAKLPKDLTETYDEIYGKIEKSGEYSRKQTLRALYWVSCSFKPLTTEELVGACSVDPETETVDTQRKTTEQHLLGWCASLLVLDRSSKIPVWRPSHFSVVEYLKHRPENPSMQHFVARACLNVLVNKPSMRHSGRSDRLTEFEGHEDAFLGSKPFYSIWVYVTQYWPRHIQIQDKPNCDPALSQLLKRFLGSPSTPSTQYRQWHYLMSNSGTLKLQFLPESVCTKFDRSQWGALAAPLAATCYFSLYHLLQDWWDPSHSHIQHSDMFFEKRNVLCIAAATGYIPLVKSIIAYGMTVNPGEYVDNEWGSPLAAAVAHGNHDVIKLLVKEGADVNLRVLTSVDFLGLLGCGSALCASVCNNDQETARLLLQAGADVNMVLERGAYGSALAAVAGRGSLEMCHLLLQAGADVNLLLRCEGDGSALAAAASNNPKICQLLLQAGANVNLLLQSGHYGSALTAAAYCDNLESCQLLLQAGADVNLLLQSGFFGSPLSAAAKSGNLEICRLLLQAGANVNLLLQIGDYGSTLAAAADSGNLEICRLLLQAGADANLLLRCGRYGSALAAAICRYDMNQLWKGTSISKTDEDEQLKLIVKLLVEHGADLDLPLEIGDYCTAMEAAKAARGQDILSLIDSRGKANVT